MIVFELSMPHVGSWNGKWTGDGGNYIRTKAERSVPKELWGKDFFYRWEDGWEACVHVYQRPYRDAQKLERLSDGFCGYDWMIRSLIKVGYITPDYEKAVKQDA